MGICPKTNSFASLITINGKYFRLRNPDGSYFDEEYTDNDIHETNTYNTVMNPAIGYQEKSEQLVKSTRNAKGQVVAQIVNRRLNKLDNLYWPYMSRLSLTDLKKEIAKFECLLGYFDTEANQWVTRRYYWGDFEATPCEWETVRLESSPGVPIRDRAGRPFYYKRPVWYKDVKCNLIDMGYSDGYDTAVPFGGGSGGGGFR